MFLITLIDTELSLEVELEVILKEMLAQMVLWVMVEIHVIQPLLEVHLLLVVQLLLMVGLLQFPCMVLVVLLRPSQLETQWLQEEQHMDWLQDKFNKIYLFKNGRNQTKPSEGTLRIGAIISIHRRGRDIRWGRTWRILYSWG
jgi:hypothetical protein